MKGSAALHILSLLMASDGDGWHQQQQVPESSSQYAPRLDLDLCDPLDVEALDLNQGLYVDGDVQEGVESWVESVIELTSSGEFVSSGDQAAVPSSSSVSSGQFFLPGQPAAHFDCSSHSDLHTLLASDNATFDSVQNFASGENIAMDFSVLVPSMSDAEEASVSALTLTPSGLEEETPRVLLEDTEGAGHLPSALWNFDLSAATFEPLGSLDGGQEVAGTSTSRRVTSWAGSTDGDMSRLSLLSSSASSLAQSLDDEDAVDDDDDAGDQQKLVLDKREKNRLAAQKCRTKKRDRAEALQKDVSRLEEKQDRLKEEVRRLQDECETLEDIIQVHGMVCPKLRKTSPH